MTDQADNATQWPRWLAALAVLHVVLALPARVDDFAPLTFLRLPVELPVLVLALVLIPLRAVRIAAAFILTPLLIVKLADMAMFFAFARPVNALADVLMTPIALDTLAKTSGLWVAASAAVGGVTLVVAIAVTVSWAARVIQHMPRPMPVAMIAGAALLVAAATPAGNVKASLFVRDHAVALVGDLRAAATFRTELAQDAFRDVPRDALLAGLKGVDVLLIFVESYGRSSLDNPDYAPVVRARLKQFDSALANAGFAARSSWLTSSTYGGESYLAHSSFVSGLWISDQQRYAQLLNSDRRTLVRDFKDAGWRTVAVLPEITMPWPEGDYFGYDKIHDATNLGYAGQPFGYMTMPDQYTLAAFQARELAAPGRAPVMAEIALISSHIPWTPVPKFVPWDTVGDGTVFNAARTTEDADAIWRNPQRLRQYYAMSLDYALETLMSFIVTYGRDDMLVIVVGDHQPMGFMADSEAREVPVHIIARDPARLAALGGDWTTGMEPIESSPIQPMSMMRARLIRAFTPGLDKTLSQPTP